ncbi:MAG: exonuclease SbcCD subunit D [Caldimicrobium sp.]
MKIILTSDWHLGKSIYSAKLIQEQALFFENSFFPLLKEIKPDILIVAGDILDKPLPDQETLSLYGDLLWKLATLNIPSLFILGNHDSRRITLHKKFLEFANLYLIDDLSYFFKPFSFQNKRGEKAFFYLLPYFPFYELLEKTKEEGVILNLEELNFENLIRELFQMISPESPSILISHFALAKGSYCGEELFIKGFSMDYLIEEALLKKFDFAFLGHLHRPQCSKEKFFYPGSPLPYSFETYAENRGVYFFELKETILHYEFIPLSPSYTLKLYKGTFEDIIRLDSTESYVKVVLQDELPVFNVYERLKEKFPNLLALEYENRKETSREINFEVLEIGEINLDEKELFKEFYQFVEDRELDLRLKEVFEKYLEEFYKLEREEGRLCQ